MFDNNFEHIIGVELRNFRNHQLIKLDFNQQIVNIIGANGVGKTSILESFSLFCSEISLRDKKIINIIKNNEENLQVKLQIVKQNISNELLFKYNTAEDRKRIFLNDSSVKKYNELRNYINLICFSPYLYAKYLHSSQFRRQFFDNIVQSFCFSHLQTVNNYNYLRQERQKILRKTNFDHDWMKIIEKKISILVIQIEENRKQCVNILQNHLQKNNYSIELCGKFEECLQNNYDFTEKTQIFQDILYKNREIDLRINQTNVGPHRTKIEILISNKNFDQCSSGEQKKAFLFILLTQAQEKIALHKIHPILLFDDIVSQFDNKNMTHIIKAIDELGVQCFITYVDKYDAMKGQIINL